MTKDQTSEIGSGSPKRLKGVPRYIVGALCVIVIVVCGRVVYRHRQPIPHWDYTRDQAREKVKEALRLQFGNVQWSEPLRTPIPKGISYRYVFEGNSADGTPICAEANFYWASGSIVIYTPEGPERHKVYLFSVKRDRVAKIQEFR